MSATLWSNLYHVAVVLSHPAFSIKRLKNAGGQLFLDVKMENFENKYDYLTTKDFMVDISKMLRNPCYHSDDFQNKLFHEALFILNNLAENEQQIKLLKLLIRHSKIYIFAEQEEDSNYKDEIKMEQDEQIAKAIFTLTGK